MHTVIQLALYKEVEHVCIDRHSQSTKTVHTITIRMNSSLFIILMLSILQLSISLPFSKREVQNAEQALVDSIISIRFTTEILPLVNINLMHVHIIMLYAYIL